MAAACGYQSAPVHALAVDHGVFAGHGSASGQQLVPWQQGTRLYGGPDVLPQGGGQPNSAFYVQLTRTLFQYAAHGHGLCGVLQDGFDQGGCQAGVGLQQNGRSASHHRAGHRCAAHVHECLLGRLLSTRHLGQFRVSLGQYIPAFHRAAPIAGECSSDLVAGGYEIRLDEVIHPTSAVAIGHAAARWATRAEGSHQVIAADGGVLDIGGSHRDHGWVMAW